MLVELPDKELYKLVYPYMKKFNNVEIMDIFGLEPNLDILTKLNEFRMYEPSKYINVKVSESLYSHIKNYCKHEDISMSSFISDICTHYLNDNRREIPLYDLIEDYLTHSDKSDYEIFTELNLDKKDYKLIEKIRNNYNERKLLREH